MMKCLYPKALLASFLLIFSVLAAFSQSGCPGCIVSLPPLPEDTIYLADPPDGIAGEYYNQDISFRMPISTTPVNAGDPNTPAGLNISKITIVSVVNLPPGLDWETNQTEFDLPGEKDGCVKFCGTPLQPGMYEVLVFVTAQVSVVTQSTSFSLPIYIAPAASSNDGFSMQNSSGCGEVTVAFENNVPSNGEPGFSYSWDFGNGQTSISEQPGEQTYATPGDYPVNFTATIDTFGFELTTVQILETGCSDIALPPISTGDPDLYLKIKDPNGTVIFQSSPADNVTMPFAIAVNLSLGAGTYELEIRDEDTFGSESCGYIDFTLNSDSTLVSGNLSVDLNIIHPVFTVQSVDTVSVFAVPAQPIVESSGLVQFCQNEEVTLTADYDEGIQWFRDTVVLFGENFPAFTTSTPGEYWVEFTSEDGCKSQSEVVTVQSLPLPAVPVFSNNSNLLSLNNLGNLPADYSLQWLVDEVAAAGETGTSFCITTPGTSLYTLVVTNNQTGCSSQFSLGVSFNPDADCLTPAKEAFPADSFRVFPNPTGGVFSIACDELAGSFVECRVISPTGIPVFEKNEIVPNNGLLLDVDVAFVPAGVYLLELKADGKIFYRRIFKM